MTDEPSQAGPSRRPRSLVTGAAGFRGSHLCEVLAAAGHEVRATDQVDALRRDDRERGWFPGVLRALGAELVPADLTRPGTLAGLVDGVDYVFHTARLSDPAAPAGALDEVNVRGTRHLLDAVTRDGGVRRFILWSSAAVYGRDGASLPSEEAPPDPADDATRTCLMQEQSLIAHARAHGLAWTVIRPVALYGPRASDRRPPALLGVASRRVVAAPADLEGRLSLVHVRDACRAALHLATRADAAGQVFNVADGGALGSREYLAYVTRLAGNAYLELPRLPLGPLRAVAAPVATALAGDRRCAGARLAGTGFEFEHPDPRRGLRETLVWYKQEGWL